MPDKEVTRLGLKEGQRFDVGPYRFEVASGDVVLQITHRSGKKVYSEELLAGCFDLTWFDIPSPDVP